MITRGYCKVSISILKGRYILIFCLFCQSLLFSQTEQLLTGIVTNGSEPVAGAVIRWQASENFVLSDNEGRFEIVLKTKQVSYLLTAWKEGFFNGGIEVK